MAEQMPYYYADEGSGFRKHFEGLIPIVILLLIGLVIVGKTTTVFCNVPGLNAVFCQKSQAKVAILGDLTQDANTQIKAERFRAVLESDAKTFNIFTQPILPGELLFARENRLKQFDAVVLVGIQNLSYQEREALGNYVNGGGKVIVIGDAGTRDPADNLIRGWSSAAFGDNFPVRLSISQPIGPNDVPRKLISQPQMWFTAEDHVIQFRSYAERFSVNLSENGCVDSINAVDVVPKDGNSKILAYLANPGNPPTILVPGIVERSSGFGAGKIIYFNYDPGCTPRLALVTIRYLTDV